MMTAELIEIMVLRSVAGPKHLTFGKGEVVSLPKTIAEEWVKTGIAEFTGATNTVKEAKPVTTKKTTKKGAK